MAKTKIETLYKKDLTDTPLMEDLILPSQWSVMQGQGGVDIIGKDIHYETITDANIESLNADKITAGTIIGIEIIAETGSIGGFNINATTLYSDGAEIVLDSANKRIEVGSNDAIVLDGENKKIIVGTANKIFIDGENKKIESDNYSSGSAGAGFHISEDLFETANFAARGLIRTAVFQKDVISSIGGNLIVLDSDVLDANMTALDASTLTIKATTTFSVGDMLRVKDGDDDEWFEVTAANGAVYTVTRDKNSDYAADTNPAWKKGATVVNYGQSGDGGIFMTASENNAPYLSVFTHSGSPWTDLSTRVRLGNLNGFNGFSSDVYGISIGVKSSGKYLNYDDGSGDLIVNDTNLVFNDIYGNGSDGTYIYSSNATLTSDMFYDDLTVNSGFTLNTGGYRIFVKGTLTVSGTISRDGLSNGTAGSNGATGQASGAGGAAGSGAGALADGSLKGGNAGRAGGAGGTGVSSPSIGGAGSSSSGVNTAKSIGANGAVGGNGGAGGDAYIPTATYNGGAVGSGPGGSRTGTVYNYPDNSIASYLLYDFLPSGDSLKSSCQSGGGGGGSAGGSIHSTGSARSGGGGGGGGAGGSGGIVTVFAKKVIINVGGYIQSNGGDGKDGGDGGLCYSTALSNVGGAGGGAGGAGGSGGVVILIYSMLTEDGTIRCLAGSAGAAGSASAGITNQPSGWSTNGANGAAGAAGNTGTIIKLQV